MIARNLQNVTVRKYGTTFLEAFGMLPLDYFGCVGDNLTDNYRELASSNRRKHKERFKIPFRAKWNVLFYWCAR